MGSATCAGSRAGCPISSGSGWTRSGWRRSTSPRSPTTAMTSPTTPRSPPSTGTWPTSMPSSARRTLAESASSWTWSSRTRRSSIRGSARTPIATSGATGRSRRTTGSRRSAGPPGAGTRRPGASTCTPSTPSSPISTGATPSFAMRWRTSSASGSTAGWTGSASTRSTGWSRTRGLRDDPPGREPFPLPVHPDQQHLDLVNSRDAPEIGIALGALRGAAGEAPLIGEVYLPSERLGPYLGDLDAVFGFDLLHAGWDADELGAALDPGAGFGRGRLGHLQPRLPARRDPVGRGERARRRGAPADPRRRGIRLPGRGDRDGRRARGRPAPRPLRPRSLPAPDAVVAGAGRGVLRGRALAAARRPRAPQRRGPARRPRIDAQPLPAPDRVCDARSAARPSGCRPRPASSRFVAGGTSSPSTRPPNPSPSEPAGPSS